MADNSWKNAVTCIVCGKKDKIMKRCGRCQLIFYCSAECQRFDWVTHKANCNISKMQESKCDNKTRQETTGSKCKTDNCKNTLHKHTYIKHSKENVCLLPINVEITETVSKPTEVELHNVVVFVKYLKEKHKVELPVPCTGVQVF